MLARLDAHDRDTRLDKLHQVIDLMHIDFYPDCKKKSSAIMAA